MCEDRGGTAIPSTRSRSLTRTSIVNYTAREYRATLRSEIALSSALIYKENQGSNSMTPVRRRSRSRRVYYLSSAIRDALHG